MNDTKFFLSQRSSLLFIVLALVFPLPCSAASLEEQFNDPPHEFSLVPFWAWNGTLHPDQLRWQMDQMKDKGIYGAFMHARSGLESSETPYFSDGWWKAVETCIEHGDKIGFHPWIYDEDKWPSGSAGGRVIKKDPERNRQKALRLVETHVTGPCDMAVSIPHARYVVAGRLLDNKRIAPDSLIDLTAYNGATDRRWSCPEGEWILRGYVFEPFHDGVNYLNKDTVRDFIDITHEEYTRRFGTHFGTTIPGVFFDEIMNDAGKNPGFHVWVEGFEERFQKMKGYNLIPLLPALTHDIGPITPKVRCDYYDVYAAIYEEAWFKQISEWCAQHNLKLTGHTIEEPSRYLTQGDYIRTINNLQIPMSDNEDFRYTWPRKIGSWKPKQIASVAHLYGKPRAGVEALGGAGWSFTLDSARYGFNMLSAYGTDFFVPHLFHYAEDSPASMDDWPNCWFFRNPYWKYFKTLSDHTRRLNFMLSGGKPVIDAAVLYPQCNLWAGHGSGTIVQTVDRLVSSQMDVDVMDPASLLRADILEPAQKGAPTLSVGTAQYRAIIVPGVRCLSQKEADKIRNFFNAGGRVIVHDWWPTESMEAGQNDPYLAQFVRDAEAHGIHPTPLDTTVSQIESALGRDLALTGENAQSIRYRHVKRDGRDIYWLVNSSRDKGVWQARFCAIGSPSLWNPEDGNSRPVSTYIRQGEYIECSVALDGGQGCFVVFEGNPDVPEGGIQIESTSLEEITTTKSQPGHLLISGYASPEIKQATVEGQLITASAKQPFRESLNLPPRPETIALGGDWEFLVVGDQLDNQWSVDVHSSEIAPPVMRMQWVRPESNQLEGWEKPSFNDREWRKIKVFDALHPEKGADRYRSRWEGRFISLNRYQTFDTDRFFSPQIGGKGFRCSKTFVLAPEFTQGRIAVLCQSPFRIFLNDTLCASGKGGVNAESLTFSGIRPGENVLTIISDDAPALLAEGQFQSQQDTTMPFVTNDTWRVSLDGREWLPAWEYSAPPEAPGGEPAHPFNCVDPDTVLYRQALPPGTVDVYEPQVEGRWEAWANGEKLSFRNGKASISAAAEGLIALRIKIGPGEHGLIKPIRVRCKAEKRALGSWTQQGLDWYSGRGIYSNTFTLGQDYVQEGTRLELDLGKVCYCAEIWLNGKLVSTRVWPPYRTDITSFVHPGKNRIDVVVANLIANQMRWDIFDDVKSNMNNRKWHDDVILRDGWCLESGLIGPVRILPFRRVDFDFAVK